MGDSSEHYKHGHQQLQSNRLDFCSVHDNLVRSNNQRANRMAESKIVMAILNLIGIPLYGYTLFINIDNAKGWILSGLAILYGIFRLYFYVRKQSNSIIREQQDKILKDLDIRHKQLDAKQREIELLERELSDRVTGLYNKKDKQ
jgi:hypothetical protein